MTAVGFTKAHENWPSMYRHPKLNILLFVYVGDFRMAGTLEDLAAAWKLIRTPHKDGCPVGIAMEDPKSVAENPKFLGCHQVEGTKVVDGKTVRTMRYDMSDFMK